MWSEETDKKIRDMMQQEPPYEEKGWEAMMPLLDKHLPQKKNRRRLLLLWLPLLLIPGTIALLLTQKGRQKQTAATEHTTIATGTQDSDTKIVTESTTTSFETATTPPVNTDNRSDKAGTEINGSLPADAAPATSSSNNTRARKTPNPLFPIGEPAPVQSGNKKKNAQKTTTGTNQLDINTTAPSIAGTTKNTTALPNQTISTTGTTIAQSSTDSETKTITTTDNNKTDTTSRREAELTKTETPKKDGSRKKKFASNFAISLSAGPEYSSTRPFNDGQWRLQYGAGLQYSFSKHFTLRTGFYAGSKVYTAIPSDYHPPAIFWIYYPNLQKIEADCKVYEVPLNLSYSFGAKGKRNFFAAAGISSVWMKKETYEYYYKDLAGQNQVRKRSISNENNHLFSTAQVSVGYQRQVSSRFSLVAEPYLKMPLSGIGYGKVKLKNGGMLFTISYKPFAKK